MSKKRKHFPNIFSMAAKYIRSWDEYGQPLALNFEGEETYKTIPGGIVSLMFLLLMASFAFVKAKSMYNVEEWTLVSQNVLQT